MSVPRAEKCLARLLFVELLAALRDDADRAEEAAGDEVARPAAVREPVAAA